MDIDSEDELYVSQSNYDTKPEWKRWMKEPTVSRDTDILKYWQSKQFQYPIIACIAKDHLAVPATSADLERIFSISGDIVTKKRN
jgi:predicted alpha/beta hydrolase